MWALSYYPKAYYPLLKWLPNKLIRVPYIDSFRPTNITSITCGSSLVRGTKMIIYVMKVQHLRL